MLPPEHCIFLRLEWIAVVYFQPVAACSNNPYRRLGALRVGYGARGSVMIHRGPQWRFNEIIIDNVVIQGVILPYGLRFERKIQDLVLIKILCRW